MITCFVEISKAGKIHTPKSWNPNARTFARQIPPPLHCSVRLCTVCNTNNSEILWMTLNLIRGWSIKFFLMTDFGEVV